MVPHARCYSLAALVVIVGTAPSLGAQQPDTRRPAYSSLIFWASPSQLLAQEEILRDLQLSTAQQEAVRKILAEYRQATTSPRERDRDRDSNFAETFRRRQEAAQKRDESLRTALGDKGKRLEQIAAQGAGLAAFVTRAELRQQLQITDEQLAKAKEILTAVYQEMTPASGTRRPGAFGTRGAEQRATFVEKSTPKLLALLTEEQKKRWQEIQGEALPAAVLAKVRASGTFAMASREAPAAPPATPASRLAASQQAFWAGKYRDAEDLARQALADAKEPNEFRGDCLISLGTALHRQQRHTEAEALFTEALAVYEKLYGPYNPRIANALGWLGNCAHHLGQLDKAAALQRKALDLREKVAGPESAEVAHCYNNLGNIALEQKKPAEAEAYHRKALAIREKTLGKENVLVALSLHNLGIICRDTGRPKEAEELGRRALELYRKANPDHGEAVLPLAMLAGICSQEKRWAEAEQYAREWLRILDKGRMEGKPLLPALDRLASILTATGRAEEAAALTKRKQEVEDKIAGKAPGKP
jgi:tetratricopeptide (TPR) repeat protein